MAFLGEKMRFPNFRHHHPIFRPKNPPKQVKNQAFSSKISSFWSKSWSWRSISKKFEVVFDPFWPFLLTFYGSYYFFKVKYWGSQILVDLAPKLLILQHNQGFLTFWEASGTADLLDFAWFCLISSSFGLQKWMNSGRMVTKIWESHFFTLKKYRKP